MKISVNDMMATSGVGFGTSGARGLVSQMTDLVCYSYTYAFLTPYEFYECGEVHLQSLSYP